MKRLAFAIILTTSAAATASAQYAYTSTSISATSDTVYASAYTEVDYYMANDYSIELGVLVRIGATLRFKFHRMG